MKNRSFATERIIFRLLTLLIFFSFCIAKSTAVFSANENADEIEAVRLSKIWDKNSTDQAIILFEKAAAQLQEANEPRKSAGCFNEALKLILINSDYETASRILSKALKIENANNLSEEKVITLSISSLIIQQKGDIKTGKKLYEEALEISKNLNSPLAKGYAFFSEGMHSTYYGNIKETLKILEQADYFASQTQDSQLINQVLQNLGFAFARAGDSSKGLDLLNRALQISIVSGDKRNIALSYFGIGFMHLMLSEKQKAIENLKKSEEMFPTDFEWLERAKLYNNFGVIYEDYGDIKSAESYRVKAYEFFGKADFPLGQLATLPSLAKLKFLNGDIAESRKTYDQMIVEANKLGANFDLAIANEGIGNLEFFLGNYDGAIKSFLESLRVYNEIEVKLPRIENNLGLAFEKKGDIETAKDYFEQALKINLETRDFLPATENLYNLARINFTKGNYDKALEEIKKSVSITESLYSDVLNSKLKRNYFSTTFDHYELYIKVLMKKNELDPNQNFLLEAIQAAEKSRARSMLENLSLSEADFVKDADTETIKREKEIRSELNIKADKLTDLLGQKDNTDEADKIGKEINELENQLEEIKAYLKQNSPIYSVIKNPAPFDVGEFQKNVLDDDSLLLEFSFGKEESYLWLVGKTEVGAYVLPPRERIETKIETLRELLASREMLSGESIETYQARIKKAEEDYWTTASDLSRDLFGQVAGKFGEKRLIVVPDGKLGYFPVSALPLPDSDSEDPILLTNEVIYEPSASTLSILANSGKQNKLSAKSLLIFSDPVFTENDARLSGVNDTDLANQTESDENFRFVESLNSLVRLEASKTEADSIVEILGAKNSDEFFGFAASRQKLLNVNAAEYKILHFATHGLIDENRPELSGIVLSRFDESGNKLDEFFRLHDIYGMNLNSDLVVLSACGTGIGKEIRGEGLMSLNNAFLSVGAKTVMASLWKVEDRATLELMKNFYAAMSDEKLTPSQALRKAQIKMWQSDRYRSPFYWAAFTVQGDYRNVPDIENNSGIWKYFLPLPLILFLGAFFGIRIIRRRNRR